MSVETTSKRQRGVLNIGDRVPDFELRNQADVLVKFADLIARGPVVIYFYPKDESAGCTAEACSFRDSYTVYQDAGAEVVGISNDSPESHRDFARHHRLPFVLLSDRGNRVRRLFGVPTTFGIIPGRVTYIIDQHGIVRHIYNSQFAATQHAAEAIHSLQQIAAHDAPSV